MTRKVRQELVRALVLLSRTREFYGHVLQQFEKVYVSEGHSVQIAAVGRQAGERLIKLYLNQYHYAGVLAGNRPQEIILGDMEHEVLHVVLGHLFVDFPDRERGSVAVDLVVNQLLPENHRRENELLPDRFNLPPGKSCRWYYNNLKSNPVFMSGGGGDAAKQGHSRHNLWVHVKGDSVAKELTKDALRRAKSACSGSYGSLPGGVAEQIDAFLAQRKPLVRWARVLRMFCASATGSVLDYTMKRESRRFGTRPGTRKGDVLNLAVIVDTSASISSYQLKLFWNEVGWIHKNGAVVSVYECDTQVHGPRPFRGKWDGLVHGRGGTRFDEALDAVEGKYDAAIYFTDFEAPKVERVYRIPMLWVLTTKHPREQWPCEWGHRVYIDCPRKEEELEGESA